MTPFGKRLRELREERGVTQKDMAAALRVSPAYLSALEHGRRGQPTWDLLQRVITYFNIIWDDRRRSLPIFWRAISALSTRKPSSASAMISRRRASAVAGSFRKAEFVLAHRSGIRKQSTGLFSPRRRCALLLELLS
jgi:transcriptional regulator with XRE-family HTH domain